MKKIKALLALATLSLALVLFAGLTPRPARADDATSTAAAAVDNQFVDGNWFDIASAKGENYVEGSDTNVALEAQLKAYQDAVEASDVAQSEHYAIRSWVKANYAAELGRSAMESGDLAGAKTALNRALKLAKAAQKPGAGKGEQADRVCDDSAGTWKGCSKIEGQRAEKYVNKLLAQLSAKAGA